jgi:HD-GYP domain-containing protein (c-di-GMP phosphodiesterase class II)
VIIPNYSYRMSQSPCAAIYDDEICLLLSGVSAKYPTSPLVHSVDSTGFAGIRLASSKGKTLGMLAALFREPIAETELVVEVLRMFSVRAASEIERDNAETTLNEVLIKTIDVIATALEKRDPYTAGHQRRVAELAVAIGSRLGFSSHELEGLQLGATVHDIGKINIPGEYLSKPGRLNSIEYAVIRQHCETGYDILKEVPMPWPVKDMILQHHERADGSGYPFGLSSKQIIPEAHIICVADVIEAMATHRPYRPALGLELAFAELEQGAGRLYERQMVEAAKQVFKDGFDLPPLHAH